MPLWELSDTTIEFGRVAGGCLARNGSSAILSTSPRSLLVVPASGARGVRALGKGGSGPGEFERPWALSCFDQDSIAVLEIARATFVRLNDESLRSFAMQPVDSGRWLEAVARLRRGRFLLRRRELSRRVVVGTVRDTVELTVATGLLEHEPALHQILRAPDAEVVRVERGNAITSALHPFGRKLLVAANDSVIHYIDTGTNDLVALSDDGTAIARLTLQVKPRVLDRKMVEQQRSQAASSRRSAQQIATDKAIQDATSLPTYLPAFDQLIVLRTGGVLIRRFLAPGDSSARWLELDANLTPRSWWIVTSDIRVLAADGGTLLGIRSEDDADTIVRIAMMPIRGR